MRNSEEIKAEIREQFGFVPPFFKPAQATPEVLENLWQQTLSAYINNPLPALFKEKLFAYLSRYCLVPYCLVCHSCALRPLGMTAEEILALLEEPAPRITTDLPIQLAHLIQQPEPLTAWPPTNSLMENFLYYYAILVYLKPYHAQPYRTELKRLLGPVYYNHLSLFLAYVKTCHQWVESYPELLYEADRRAQLYLAELLESEPALADFFHNYSEKVRQENQNQEDELIQKVLALQQVELSLNESNSIMRAVIESTTDAIFVKDIQGRYLIANATTANIFDKSVAEIIGKKDTDLLLAEEARKIIETDREIMATHQTQIVEEVITINNIARTYLATKDIYRDREGNAIGLIGIAQDITERKQIEAQLYFTQFAIDRSTDAAFWIESDGQIFYVNDAACKLLGYSRAELLSMRVQDINLEVSDQNWSQLWEASKQGIATMIETRHRTKDGTILPVEVAINYLEFNGKEYNCSFVREISDRKRLETEREQLLEELKKQKEHLQLQIDRMPIGCIIKDKDFRFTEWNPAADKIFGYTKEEVLGKHVYDLSIVPENAKHCLDKIFRRLAQGDMTAHCINQNRTKEGRTIICEWYNTPLKDAGGTVVGFISMVQDITQRQKAEEALKESERRYQTLATAAPVGILRMDAKGYCIYANERWCALSKLTVEASLGEGWVQALHPDDSEWVKRKWYEAVTENLPFEAEYRFQSPDGTIAWVLGQAIAEKGSSEAVIGYIGTIADITERKHAEKQLRYYAFYDPLTGLPNRALFLKHLKQAIGNPDERWQNPDIESEFSPYTEINFSYLTCPWPYIPDPPAFAVLFLDLNRFQLIKYSLGHLFADQLIVAVARRIQGCLGNFGLPIEEFGFEDSLENSEWVESNEPSDNPKSKIQNLKFTVARLGLDEFAILLANFREVGVAIDIAEYIYQEFQLPFTLDGREVFVSSSIGIAPSSIGYERAEDFLRAADTAVHHAKKLGKAGGYAVFQPEWHAGAVDRLQLETDLRWAIERQELRVYYQPIVSLASNGATGNLRDRITGFEALVRWQHPIRGFICPAEFIPLAEETGLIALIDRWVLREACRQMAIWQEAFPTESPLTISVNLSGLQLSQLGLIEQIDQILQETRIIRQSLKLEITESRLIGNTSFEVAMLEQLKELGIQLLIDDFGTGYSSLARLHQMPIDTLKIDRSFVSQMSGDSESLEIVRTIITLAHSLGMDAIAEGVETAEQLAQLQALQCEYGQGYLFSKPVNNETASALLNR